MTLLQRHRLAAGLTQTALAKKLKVVPATVSLWESGANLPHPKQIPVLARILGLDAMTLTRVIEPEPAAAK
jgi:transcriptional regulator with XRE-family HTH domain